MNNENKDFFTNEIETNISEEEIILAPPTELIEEAKEIAQSTLSDEKFPFALQYDSNQKEFLLSMLETVGAIVENDDDDGHVLTTMMNMTQLAFIKRCNCVEKVKTDAVRNSPADEEFEKLNPSEITSVETVTPQPAKATQTNHIIAISTDESETATNELAMANYGIAVACDDESSSSCCCPSNTTMESATELSIETSVRGCICCPGAEQWFKFTVPMTKVYTIYTKGSLDTVGTLYDCCGNCITTEDDINGDLNFRMVQILSADSTYYLRVRLADNDTGNYTIKITNTIFANSVNINKSSITLSKGVRYELPAKPNYTYKGYLGAKPISGLSVSVVPANATSKDVWWWEQNGNVLECSYGWDDDGDRYIHVTAKELGTAKLYAQDRKEHGKRDECVVNVDNMLIYRTRNRERLGFNDSSDNNDTTPITAEDLTYGGKSTQTLIANGTSISMSDLNNYSSISQRVTIVKNFFNSQIGYDETFMTILSEMVDHFVAGTGTDYTNAALTAAVQSQSRTVSYVNAVIELVKNYISQHKDTIDNLAYDEDLWTQPIKRSSHPLVKAMNDAISNGATELYLPYYGFNNGVPGLTLALDGFYGNKIRLINFQSTGNTYSCALEFTFYDHFGLDTPDLRDEKYSSMTAGMFSGFRQWFILQHWNDLEGSVQPKPFVTNVTFSVSISGTYE